MTGLNGARVIVVDDDENDALPILKAFARKGIPTAFFDGSLSGLPLKRDRLLGVRLAILDMDLIGGGVSNKSKAAALVKCLERILNPNNGPYAVLAWTNNPDLLEVFEDYVCLAANFPKPIFSVMLTKAECRNKREKLGNLEVISKKLDDKLMQISPLMFLQAWEEKCFSAATEVTNTLSDLASSGAAELDEWRSLWKTQLLKLMHAMSGEAVGTKLSEDLVLGGLYSSLNPLHTDRLESNTAALSASLNSTEIIKAPADPGIERKARINSMLHLSFENLEHFTAGNLYKFSSKRKPKWMPNPHQLLEDFIHGKKGTEQTSKKIDKISKSSVPVLVEISAACDHAQKNIRVARFIFGLIVPAAERKKLNCRAGFIWEFGPFFLEKLIADAGQYYFYFSARDIVALDLKKALKMKAVARIRRQALSDLQFWLAHHSARPGMMLLRSG
jgi:hypothetical protein